MLLDSFCKYTRINNRSSFFIIMVLFSRYGNRQKSRSIKMLPKRCYYIEAVQVETGGGDSLSVGVKGPKRFKDMPMKRRVFSRCPCKCL